MRSVTKRGWGHPRYKACRRPEKIGMNSAAAIANCTIPKNLERLAGIEPVVESLEDSYSAIELQPRNLERSAGIEPASRHWQCRILPLNHDRQIWWRRRGMIPRYQFAGLESSQLDDAPKFGAQSGLGFRDLWFVGPALITHLS